MTSRQLKQYLLNRLNHDFRVLVKVFCASADNDDNNIISEMIICCRSDNLQLLRWRTCAYLPIDVIIFHVYYNKSCTVRRYIIYKL